MDTRLPAGPGNLANSKVSMKRMHTAGHIMHIDICMYVQVYAYVSAVATNCRENFYEISRTSNSSNKQGNIARMTTKNRSNKFSLLCKI